MVNPTAEFQATSGLVAAVRGLNAAATYYAEVFGAWPRFHESVARILQQPLEAVELQQQLVIAPLVNVVPGSQP